MLKTEELIEIITNEAEALKANEIEVYDVSKQSNIVDYFIICSGTSNVHVESIANRISDKLREVHEKVSLDGTKSSKWIVIDVGPVMVHVMGVEERSKYNLEQIWKNSSIIYH
ncbi:MAG: ribosome silencing factor [Candidatus Margulisiibacteriota bacterium]|nr:MAG: ribosome silencing factor [Candidatus Margulisbacteria bacterium GWD2_39_127]OGI02759.1 MAG: ribosome silencing factor [Candidatus Margulisbacteria bacterium GWF2_38_17]OGI09354.1 MAG: ribosome silencing factor [Candidatus Margulisbacteria bacterium GWE2_39_32]PZM77431.1 MAG: ribosome silencing factor [Candidatus Margulisiibacteriota bacterium]HAR64006.1 ribosome silencing factor [Candidatus Margulisiibacteriota bacterium]